MAIVVIGTLITGCIDYWTGIEFRMEIFYLIPILYATWFIGKRPGIAASVISLFMIFLSDLMSGKDYNKTHLELWNLAMYLGFFVIVAVLMSGLRTTLDEQKKLSRELQKALHESKTANEALEAFTYSASHDLRAPLWHINGFAQLLAEKYADRLDGTGNDFIVRISSNAQRMQDLIDALLSLSRISRTDLNRSAVDLTSLVRKAIQDCLARWPGRMLETHIAERVTADGDPALLGVVIFNLVENAVKFTNGRPHALLEFGLTTVEGKDVYFIRDNGAGFSMEHASRLFTPFQRLHAEVDFPGSGIGLATVLRIIQRHGGRIWAEGEVNAGATFYFTVS